jgi:ABC-type transporter Mla subunit MlaD
VLLQPLAAEASDRRRAVRVGVIVIVAVVVLVGALLVTGPLAIASGQRLRVDFAFCGPVKPGASVRLSGVVVGVVEDVELLAGRDREAGPQAMVRVHARVKPDVGHLLTAHTRFYVTTLGVLGEHYLDIAPSTSAPTSGPTSAPTSAPLGDNARVDGVTLARADLLLPRASALLDTAGSLLPSGPELERMVATMSSLLRTLDELLHDDEQRSRLAGGVDDVRALVADLRTLVRGAATGIGDGRALRSSLEALPPVLEKTGRLEDLALSPDVQGELRSFVTDARMMLQKTTPLVDALARGPAGDVDTQRRALEKLEATLVSLDAAAVRADRLLGVVEAKRGVGRLVYDDDAADDLKAILHELRNNPMKFLLR